MMMLDAMPELPVLQAPSLVDPYPNTVAPMAQSEMNAITIVGGIAFVGLLFGVGYLYNRWAYDDWTCMFKQCMQTSTKRR